MNRRTLLAAVAGVISPLLGVRTATADAAYWEGVVRDAASRHGVSPDWLASVCACESGFDPNAYNPRTGDSGLMQFNAQTFATFCRMSGIYGDIWNGHDSAEVAAWAFGAGYCDHWVCGCWDGQPS